MMKKSSWLSVAATVLLLTFSTAACKKADEAAEKLKQQQLNLSTAEKLYLERLSQTLGATSNLEGSSQASVFVSATTVNQVLSVLNGISGTIPSIPNATFHVRSFESAFRDGFPLLKLVGEAERPDLGLRVELAIYAAIQPIVRADQPGSLVLSFQVVDALPVVQWGKLEAKIEGFVKNLIQVKLTEYAAAFPEIRVPLRSDFSIDLPPNEQSVSFPVPNGTVTGVISVPGIHTAQSIYIHNVVFLSDGLHVMMTTVPGPGEAPLAFPLQEHSQLTGAQLDSHVNSQESKVKALQQSLAPKLAPIHVTDASIRIWISQTLFASLAAAFNSLPAPSRHLHYRTTSTAGQLVSTGGGAPFGCGYYAEITDGNSASGDADLSNIRSRWTADGSLSLDADYAIGFSAQVSAHGNSFPGFCMVRNSLGITAPDVHGGLQCRCPTGGGIGTSVGVTGNKGGSLSARIGLRSDATAWLAYDLALTGPPNIDVTLSAGLGRIGTLGVPVHFPLPLRTLASGVAPPVFMESGTVSLGNPRVIRRGYQFSFTPKSGQPDSSGYSVKGEAAVRWLTL
jgi:hypothetical protein